MILWRMLTEGVDSKGIDSDEVLAYQWIRSRLPEMFSYPLDANGKNCRDEAGREVADPRFDWRVEWPKWQRNLEALNWLAERKRRPPPAGSDKDRIPRRVDAVLMDTLGKTRPAILAEYLSEARIVLLFSGVANALPRFDSLDEFWQVVFVSFFQPDFLPHGGSYCTGCGRTLPPTKRLKKSSKAKLCGSCRVAKYRRDHPDESREANREQKRRERKR